MDRLHISSHALLEYKNAQIKILEDLLKKAKKHPTTKNIHKIRVSIRRLGVVLTSTKLKHLAKVLGKERDLDVAMKNARSYGMGVGKLKKNKNTARKKTETELKEFNLRNLHNKKDTKLLINFKRLMRKLNLELEDDNEDLHLLRIRLKHVRYGFEAIGQFHVKLQNMQDLLGHIHDLEVLQKLKGDKKAVQRDKESATEQAHRNYNSTIRLVRKTLDRI